MAVSEIVAVTIQAGTVNPARRGFGVPLLLMYHDAWAGDEVRTYTTFTGVAADFDSATEGQRRVYQAAAALFAQNPRPEKIKVARLPTPGSGQITTLDFTDMASGVDIEGTMIGPDGTSTAISVTWDTNLATTLAQLEIDLEAAGAVTVDDTGSPIVTVTADNAGETFDFEFTTDGIDIRDTTADWDYDDRLDNVITVDADFYCVMTEVNSPVNMDKVARWVLANDRFALFGPQYTKPSQFAASEFTLTADHTALLANDQAAGLFTKQARASFVEAAWAGGMLPRDPGSATWAFKQLEGVGADDWTSTERTTIEDATRQANHYATELAVGVTRPGKTFGGEWIDVVRGLDWLKARLEEALFALLVNNPKIPYTEAGVSMILAAVRSVLRIAEDRGVLASGWTVTALAVADQDAADKTARILRDVEFSATLAGAIHMINVTGTVTA